MLTKADPVSSHNRHVRLFLMTSTTLNNRDTHRLMRDSEMQKPVSTSTVFLGGKEEGKWKEGLKEKQQSGFESSWDWFSKEETSLEKLWRSPTQLGTELSGIALSSHKKKALVWSRAWGGKWNTVDRTTYKDLFIYFLWKGLEINLSHISII